MGIAQLDLRGLTSKGKKGKEGREGKGKGREKKEMGIAHPLFSA